MNEVSRSEIRRNPTSSVVSVVIPTYNRVETLFKVLQALEVQTLDRPAYEVVVVDDGSTDATSVRLPEEVERSPLNICYVRQENRGPAAARNAGIQAARGELLVFLGDDTIPEPDFLAEHLRYHEHQQDDLQLVVVGYTKWSPELTATPFMRFIGEHGPQFDYARMSEDTALPYFCLYTSNLSLHRSLLAKLDHVFDEDFPSAMWEDTELGYRLAQVGMKLYFHRRAVTRHDHPTTVASFCRRFLAVGEASRLLLRKHPEMVSRLRSTHSLRCWARWTWGFPAAVSVVDYLDRTWRLPLPKICYRALVAAAYARGASQANGSHGAASG